MDQEQGRQQRLVTNRTILTWAVGCLILLGCRSSEAQESRPLLNVSAGQLPNDTGSDGKSKLRIEAKTPLGIKALKVAFAKGDSFGMNNAGPSDWAEYDAFEFNAFNPSRADVKLTLAIKHRRSTSYNTRVEAPIVLKPGKNAVRLDISRMLNVNGSVPDMKSVRQWYIAAPGIAPTIYFSDISLTGGSPAERHAPAVTAVANNGLRGDPARLRRIRAARMPKISKPVSFDTPEADAILSALEVFPENNAFNQVISTWPVHPNSSRIVASMGADKPLRYNPDMGFMLVPPKQPRVPVKIVDYPSESDPGPYPIPDNTPIEGWPATFQRSSRYRRLSLLDVQRDIQGLGGDRHAIVVDPTNRILYEFYIARRTPTGWQAAQASIFDLSSNKLRPEGWTSSDAAGLPVFPAVVRYDELKRGIVEHAMRVTARRTRRAYVHPATHYASRDDSKDLPRMGERLRLRRDFDESKYSSETKAILRGLKKYGMLVADNGIDWAISVTPDPRIPELHDELRTLKGSDFEVVISPDPRYR